MSKVFIDDAGMRHVFPDDATDAEIDEATRPPAAAPAARRGASARGPIPYDVATSALRATSPSIPIPPLSSFSTLGGLAGGAGGAALGLATGPAAPWAVPTFGASGAVVGGSIGEGIRERLSGQRLNMGRVAQEGKKQGLAQVAGMGLGRLGSAIGPMAKGAQAMMESPVARAASRVGRLGLPVGGALSHGIPGALAGAVLPYVGREAMKIATSPATEALLKSPAFQRLARQSPRLARQLWEQMSAPAEPDATQP
jgi:hypothetical protein